MDDYWYNRDKYVVMGFSRCGSTALAHFLHCGHSEMVYGGVSAYLEKYSQCIPVVITRDPVDRIWSAYNYFGEFRNMKFEDFLDFRDKSYNEVGVNDPIMQSDYERYIEPFRKYGVIVYRFEDVIKKDYFPKVNNNGKKTPPMPDSFRKMIEDRLHDTGIQY